MNYDITTIKGLELADDVELLLENFAQSWLIIYNTELSNLRKLKMDRYRVVDIGGQTYTDHMLVGAIAAMEQLFATVLDRHKAVEIKDKVLKKFF